MNSTTEPNQPLGEATTPAVDAVFGFEDFWPRAYAEFRRQFDAIKELMRLADDMLLAAESKVATPITNLISDLTRMTLSGACEAILLCGNGCGAGAMKIVRGMYESRWTAEYLHRNPAEVAKYVEFSKVLLWRKLVWLQNDNPAKASSIPQEVTKRIEDEFNQVKPRFENGRGRVRWQWSEKTIRQIAQDIEREAEYDLPYSVSCSIHHGSFEGLLAHFDFEREETAFVPPPSIQWIEEALLSVHVNVWFALNTLNDSCALTFDAQLDAAQPTLSHLARSEKT